MYGAFEEWLKDVIFELDINKSLVKLHAGECVKIGEGTVCKGYVWNTKTGEEIVGNDYTIDKILVCTEILRKLNISINKYSCKFELPAVDEQKLRYEFVAKIVAIDKNITEKDMQYVMERFGNALKNKRLCDEVEYSISKNIRGYIICYVSP